MEIKFKKVQCGILINENGNHGRKSERILRKCEYKK